MRALLKLTWLEIKIFMREPLGVVGSVVIPVVIFLGLSRGFGPALARPGRLPDRIQPWFLYVLPTMFIALSAVTSLVAIIAIYREGGILKRLRATPMRPYTILGAHVLVKLLLTVLSVSIMGLAGRRYFPPDTPFISYVAALVLTTVSLLSIGFVIASVVPTARFAQPFTTLILYSMLVVSGLFFGIGLLPAPLALVSRVLPLTYAVSLLRGIALGEPWSTHAGDVLGLFVTCGICSFVSTKVFRWE